MLSGRCGKNQISDPLTGTGAIGFTDKCNDQFRLDFQPHLNLMATFQIMKRSLISSMKFYS